MRLALLARRLRAVAHGGRAPFVVVEFVALVVDHQVEDGAFGQVDGLVNDKPTEAHSCADAHGTMVVEGVSG